MTEGRKRRAVIGPRRPKQAAAARRPETDELLRDIGALLVRLVETAQRGGNAEPGPTLAAARQAAEARRRRERLFGRGTFADLSWDILLDLFIAELEGRRTSVSSACIAASAPSDTALRHIAHLAQAGLVSRRPHPSGSRSAYLEITEEGSTRLTEYFSL